MPEERRKTIWTELELNPGPLASNIHKRPLWPLDHASSGSFAHIIYFTHPEYKEAEIEVSECGFTTQKNNSFSWISVIRINGRKRMKQSKGIYESGAKYKLWSIYQNLILHCWNPIRSLSASQEHLQRGLNKRDLKPIITKLIF